MAKNEYKEEYEALCVRLSELQREIRTRKIPVIISFDGWSASGKGVQINKLLQGLDPRGYTVETMHHEQTISEKLRPYLWRFWVKTPPRGEFVIFDRGWYMCMFDEPDKDWTDTAEHIRAFETSMAADGNIIMKFFLSVSKKEQKRRLELLESSDATSWRVNKRDKRENKHYDELSLAYSEIVRSSDRACAPWYVIDADDFNHACIQIMRAVVKRLEEAVSEADKKPIAETITPPENEAHILEETPTRGEMEKSEYKKRMDDAQAKLYVLQNELYRRRIPLICVFEGMDAAGKGGAIKRMTRRLDPRAYNVVPSSAPSDIEKSHHYLWRYWINLPKAGHITVFDRSWYGRVLVERIEGFAREDEWQRAYSEICDFEQSLATSGAIICKFWLHLDKDEQEKRFIERRDNPQKSWKLTDEDWRNRDKWDLYTQAANDMIAKTSQPCAPWTIVEADNKYFARLKVIETVTNAIKSHLGGK